MEKKKNLAGKLALCTAAFSGAYIYTIMPRVIRKPDKSAFQTRFFCASGTA
jgi:glucokinase